MFFVRWESGRESISSSSSSSLLSLGVAGYGLRVIKSYQPSVTTFHEGALVSSRELPVARAHAHPHCRMPDGPCSSRACVCA